MRLITPHCRWGRIESPVPISLPLHPRIIKRTRAFLQLGKDFPLIYDQKENLYRSVRFTGEPSREFACDLAPFLRFQTLDAAIQHRDWLESDAGKAEIAEKEARREQKRQYDLAREERREQHSTARQFEHDDDAADTVVFV